MAVLTPRGDLAGIGVLEVQEHARVARRVVRHCVDRGATVK
jgi:hypothetical protein